MKKPMIIVALLILNVISCQESKKIKQQSTVINQTQSNMDTLTINEEKIKDYYKKHIDVLEENDDYYMGEEDIKIAIPILVKGLQNNGFKPILDIEFKEKLQSIFGINLDKKCYNILDHKDFFTYSMQECKSSSLLNDCIENNKSMEYFDNIFFIKKYNFLTILPTLWTIAKIENNQIKIKLPQSIISRNKYLFNNDKSQFVWLTYNDGVFMESLVKEFGYTEDEKLLTWVINKTKFNENNPEDFGKLFWNKRCDGKVKLHFETFKILQNLYKPNDNSEMRFLLDYIQKYIEYLGDFDKLEDQGILESDRVKILSNLAYFAEQYKYKLDFYNTSNRMMGRLRYLLDDKQREILQKNNYFDLPMFKTWWDKAKYDEAYVIECEYGGICGRDNPGPDPNDY